MSKNRKRLAKIANASAVEPKWSPYGCHYYPDMTEFPDPRVETLPEEPLQSGEQYFLDLAGNIKKVRANFQNYYCVISWGVPHFTLGYYICPKVLSSIFI